MNFPYFRILLPALFVPCPLLAALAEWETSVGTGQVPVSTWFSGTSGPPISGFLPQVLNVGELSGPRSFEFIVYAGNAGGSSALMGLSGVQSLKFEQWQDTGHPGMTTPGVMDYDSDVAAPLYRKVQMVYTSDEVDTKLYIDGELAHTFEGVPLMLTGEVGLGANTDAGGGSVVDPLDGHILGFASYDVELSPAEIATHHAAFSAGEVPVFPGSWRTAVTSAGVVPSAAVFSPVSGRAPVTVNVGTLEGPRTFEFLYQAGEAGQSEAFLGRAGVQGLKFRQWDSTDLFGLTEFGVADHLSEVPSLYHEVAQVAYVYDGASTGLYVNGELQYTFENIPLALTGNVGLGAAASITGDGDAVTFRDPLDGMVLRFASYDTALDEGTIMAHHAAFVEDGGSQNFGAWQTLVNAGTPSAVVLEPASGESQTTVDVGPLAGDRTFEFIVNAGLATGSTSLLGGNQQALKYEQWQDTGMMGITAYGVADHVSTAPAPEFVDTHVVFVSNGTDTDLYVDGVLQFTFSGVALTGTGLQGLATAAALPVFSATFFDPLDGHILGFASYPEALTEEELKAHHTALMEGGMEPPAAPFRIVGITRNATTGALTLSWGSEDTATYRIESGTDPAVFDQIIVNNFPAVPGGTTSHTFVPPAGSERLFFRVVRL